MDPSLEHSILQTFPESQQWTQQFIVEDSGKSVDLSSASIKLSPRTPDNAQNQPPSYPDRSVYRFDPTKFRGKESFDSLVLMIQNSLHGAKFSFVRGSRNNRFILWCSLSRLQEKKQIQTHSFPQGNTTQEGLKYKSVKEKSTTIVSSIDAVAGKRGSKAIKCSMTSTVSNYSDKQPSKRRSHSKRKTNKKDCCKCRIAFFLWPDGFYYLDHKTTNLTHNGHPESTPDVKLKAVEKNEESRYTPTDFQQYSNQKLDHGLSSSQIANDNTYDTSGSIQECASLEYEKEGEEEESVTSNQENNMALSPVVRRLQSEIEESHKCNTWSLSPCNFTEQMDLMSDESKDEIRKKIIATLDSALSSAHMPAVFAKRFEERVLKKLIKVEAYIEEFKTELFQELKESDEAGESRENTTMCEFACDENKSAHGEKRKRNGLDY